MNKISDQKIKRIIEAKQAGSLTTQEIASSLNVSKDVVVKYWKFHKQGKLK